MNESAVEKILKASDAEALETAFLLKYTLLNFNCML